MTLAETLLKQLDDPTLTQDERAQLRCQIAADLEHRGQYEAARDALAELWQGVGQPPALEGLSELAAAEVLLCVGTLSGWLGSVNQIEGAQDAAKDLIFKSIARFQAIGEKTRVATAQSELGYCYYRAGAYDEARVIYHEALKPLSSTNHKELRAKILLRLSIVDFSSGRYNDALRILTDSAELFEEGVNDALKGRFHNDLACVLMSLGKAEQRMDYTDRAIIEYTAASHLFGLAGHISYRARAENNLGFLLYTIERYKEAHEHLNRARPLFIALKDIGSVAQVDETRARVLLAQGLVNEAQRAISETVRTLEKGDDQPLLTEALTTQGRVLSKLGNFNESLNTLRRAANLAEQAGAVEHAGRALLTLLEEHADRINEYDLLETYQHANNLIKETQDAENVARLRKCASRIMSARLALIRPKRSRSLVDFWANFNLNERVHAYEARYIQRALIDADGSITRAARLLGLLHHTTLAHMLDEEQGRHKDLAHLRTPPEPRRQSIIPSEYRRPPSKARTVKILCVEDYKVVADAIKDTLEEEGWTVELCDDGTEAVRKIESTERYDLLLLDNDLPGKDGIEIIRCARGLPHRQRTPIIMLSASDVERDARMAGTDAFLKKPQDIKLLTATVTQLLTKDITGK